MEQLRKRSQLLHEEVTQGLTRLTSSCADKSRSVDKLVKEHQNKQRSDEDVLRTLSQQEIQYKQRANEIRNEESQEVELLKSKMEQLDLLKEQASSVTPELKGLREKYESEKENLQQFKAVLQEKEKANSYRVAELTKGVQFYKERLGLDFQRVGDNRLRVVFTQIDPDQPNKEFWFSVHVNENDIYQIEDCVPAVGGVSKMLDELNTSNNFSSFVQAMRRKFKERL
eukprot:GILK01002951.1.p1 GENE.GILK01002951.1~~GILK01002951.1.p1  ORF type:complete len:245 (+),score=60.84 GILK01002951.1:57-737(+)